MKVVERVTLADVRAAQPEMIYYGAVTTWWTHDPKHLNTLEHGLPCDPRGGVLFQTDDVEGFLTAAEANAAHYGRHGLAAFVGAHALNCLTNSGAPWCTETFEEINHAIDQSKNES
jgi:hypothetical protein